MDILSLIYTFDSEFLQFISRDYSGSTYHRLCPDLG